MFLIMLQACNFIEKETLAQVFSCEFYKISKNTFFYRTTLGYCFWIWKSKTLRDLTLFAAEANVEAMKSILGDCFSTAKKCENKNLRWLSLFVGTGRVKSIKLLVNYQIDILGIYRNYRRQIHKKISSLNPQ